MKPLIMTPAMKREKEIREMANGLMICNIKRRKDHCNTMCVHGKPHPKETHRGACHNTIEICSIHKGVVKVKCRLLTLKEKNKWIKDIL